MGYTTPLPILLLTFTDSVVGNGWEQAKTQTEVRTRSIYHFPGEGENDNQCLDYLFEIAVKMKLAGVPVVLEEEL